MRGAHAIAADPARVRAPVRGPRALGLWRTPAGGRRRAVVRRGRVTRRLAVPPDLIDLARAGLAHPRRSRLWGRVEEGLAAVVLPRIPALARELRLCLDAERLEVVLSWTAARSRQVGPRSSLG
jgi:hypothetical protein